MAEVKLPANPFRSRPMRNAWEGAMRAYLARHRDLIREDGSRCNGNSIAVMFWRGYDNTNIGRGFDDRASRQLLAYVWWRAGRAARIVDEQRGAVVAPQSLNPFKLKGN